MCSREVDRRTQLASIAIHNAQVRAQARPGAIHMADADGWVSPFEAGHPDCPLSGEFSNVGRGRMTLGAWVGVLVIVLLALACSAGLGFVGWVLVNLGLQALS